MSLHRRRTGHAATASGPTPLVWYQFNDSAAADGTSANGATLTNSGSGGSGLNATITGCTWQAGYNGSGKSLRLVSGSDFVATSATTTLNLTTSGTVMVRIKGLDTTDPKNWNSSGFMGLFAADYTLNLWANSSAMRGFVVVASGRGDIGLSNSNFNINNWNHFAVAYPVAVSGGTGPQLYLNGTAVGSTRTDLTGNFSYSQNNKIELRDANADIDDFRLYTSVLTAAEIAAISAQ
jgi:hypothetical protein